MRNVFTRVLGSFVAVAPSLVAVFSLAFSASAVPMFQGLGDLPGGSFTSVAQGISDDGLTVVGFGRNPSGFNEAWIATIPEPNTAFLLMSGLLGLSVCRRDRVLRK